MDKGKSGMKILIACEESGVVRRAFRRRDHDAISCDLMPSADSSEHHMQCDVRDLLGMKWDMIIAFPPCTHLCVSGARWWKTKPKEELRAAEDFFMLFANHPCPRIAIENPIGRMSSLYRKPDQIIQPWQFGDDASKATCLWLKGLPALSDTNRLPGGSKTRRANQTASGQNKLGPSPERARLRSQTYPGIAYAMADQWWRLS